MRRSGSLWGAQAMITIENVCLRVYGMLIIRNADRQERMRISWALVRIHLRCDANHNLSLCARPGFGSALHFYIDTLVFVCLQCFRSIFRI